MTTTPAPGVTPEMIEAAAKAYADATDYYVQFHAGLKSDSADRIRRGVAAALAAALRAQPIPGTVGVRELPRKPTIDDEASILARLAAGDTISYSRDGDTGWFLEGDGAWVGDAVIALRKKGYLLRVVDPDAEMDDGHDTISDAGRLALSALTQGSQP